MNIIRPARPDYVPPDAHYAGPVLDTGGKIGRVAVWVALAAAAWLLLALIAGAILLVLPDDNPGVPMPSTKYSAPVIPGPAGARRAPLVSTAAAAARHGQPGHLERLIDPGRPGIWPISERAAAIGERGDR